MYTDKFPNCWFAVLRSIRPKRELDRGIDEDRAMLHSRMLPSNKNPPKIGFIKFVKLTRYTYACNSLTNFKYEAHGMTGNGNQVNLLKFAWKSSLK